MHRPRRRPSVNSAITSSSGLRRPAWFQYFASASTIRALAPDPRLGCGISSAGQRVSMLSPSPRPAWPPASPTSAFFDTLPNVDTGKVVQHLQPLGQLELRDLLVAQELRPGPRSVSACPARRITQAHIRSPSTGSGIRHAGDVLHRRMLQDQVLDLLGADLLAAAVDQVLLAALHHVVPRRMLPHQIARAVEAVGRERPRVVLRRAVVAAQRVRSARAELADLAERHLVVVVVDQPHLVVRATRAAARFPAARLPDRRGARTSACPRPCRSSPARRRCGISSFVRMRTSGCRRWPPLWMSRSDDSVVTALIAGSLISRISSAGTTLMCVTRCRSTSAEHLLRPRRRAQHHPRRREAASPAGPGRPAAGCARSAAPAAARNRR